ncbi:hypothetical protein [Streptomyces sp. NPDC001401]|uniref:hypothetical protein n=1 Tax=Streptomyces sp. NPDC001401 TaxID=3364570 RepID=UPI00369E7671
MVFIHQDEYRRLDQGFRRDSETSAVIGDRMDTGDRIRPDLKPFSAYKPLSTHME